MLQALLPGVIFWFEVVSPSPRSSPHLGESPCVFSPDRPIIAPALKSHPSCPPRISHSGRFDQYCDSCGSINKWLSPTLRHPCPRRISGTASTVHTGAVALRMMLRRHGLCSSASSYRTIHQTCERYVRYNSRAFKSVGMMEPLFYRVLLLIGYLLKERSRRSPSGALSYHPGALMNSGMNCIMNMSTLSYLLGWTRSNCT